MNLSEEEFKNEFYNKIKDLALGNKNKKYKIRSFQNQTKWFGTNLTKLEINASNEYDCWLQLHKILYEKSNGTYDLYDYDHIIECAEEEWYDKYDENIKCNDMEFIVKNHIKLFCENDTLWCIEI